MKEIRDLIKRMKEHLAEGADDPFSAGYDDATELWKTELEALLPPRTLADLTEEERADCQWRQGYTEEGGLILIVAVDESSCFVTWRDGATLVTRPFSKIIPRFDLPKLNPWDQPSARSVKTEEDYDSLPEGSIVAADSDKPWVRLGDRFWGSYGPFGGVPTADMVGVTGVVLREGWES